MSPSHAEPECLLKMGMPSEGGYECDATNVFGSSDVPRLLSLRPSRKSSEPVKSIGSELDELRSSALKPGVWLSSVPSASKTVDLEVSPAIQEIAKVSSQWKSDVARLAEEIGQLRSTAAWALPDSRNENDDAEMCCPQLSRIETWPLLPAACGSSSSLLVSRFRAADVSARSCSSRDDEECVLMLGSLDSRRPRGRARDVKITANTERSKAPSPTPQISCGGGSSTPRKKSSKDLRTKPEPKILEGVNPQELKQLLRDLETMRREQLLLQQVSQENSALQQEKAACAQAWEHSLQTLQQENATLQEENATLQEEKLHWESVQAQLEKSHQENAMLREEALRQAEAKDLQEAELATLHQVIATMREERLVQEERYRRDVTELEGMLEPVMSENAQLKVSLKEAEARLEAGSCDIIFCGSIAGCTDDDDERLSVVEDHTEDDGEDDAKSYLSCRVPCSESTRVSGAEDHSDNCAENDAKA